MMEGNPAVPAPMRIALFEYGFRPFFLLAGLQAALALLAWLAVFANLVEWDGAWLGSHWHGHEMIFGFAVASMAGFLLTAVPNWTDTPALRGAPLAGLAALWLVGRVAIDASATLPPLLVAVIDLAFLPAFAVAVARPLVARARRERSPRNLVFVVLLGSLWAGDLLAHLDALGVTSDMGTTGLLLGRDTLLLAISVVGGRIIPAFTRNTLGAAGAGVRNVAALDAAAIGGLALMLLADLTFGEGMAPGAAALLAALANTARLVLWRPLRTRGRPILWVLHLGYAWLAFGLWLKAGADLFDWIPDDAGLHALTVGAVGTMLIAVMSRVALGHAGRPLVAGRVTVAAYLLVSLAASLRVAAPFVMTAYIPLILASGLVWSLAFALFTAVYLPILVCPRADGKPG